MTEEISKKSLSILVVIVVVISLLGTFMILNRKPEIISTTAQQGKWSVTILPQEESVKVIEQSDSQGQIFLEVLPPEE